MRSIYQFGQNIINKCLQINKIALPWKVFNNSVRSCPTVLKSDTLVHRGRRNESPERLAWRRVASSSIASYCHFFQLLMNRLIYHGLYKRHSMAASHLSDVKQSKSNKKLSYRRGSARRQSLRRSKSLEFTDFDTI